MQNIVDMAFLATVKEKRIPIMITRFRSRFFLSLFFIPDGQSVWKNNVTLFGTQNWILCKQDESFHEKNVPFFIHSYSVNEKISDFVYLIPDHDTFLPFQSQFTQYPRIVLVKTTESNPMILTKQALNFFSDWKLCRMWNPLLHAQPTWDDIKKNTNEILGNVLHWIHSWAFPHKMTVILGLFYFVLRSSCSFFGYFLGE